MVEMRNIKLTIEYDGKDFNGWQKQPTKLNIQGTIEQAIKQITGEEVQLDASGRTDAGVHAFGQVANFKTNSQIPIEKFAIAINSKLKRSIVIKKAEEVDERFHSRLSCKKKTYRYIINNIEQLQTNNQLLIDNIILSSHFRLYLCSRFTGCHHINTQENKKNGKTLFQIKAIHSPPNSQQRSDYRLGIIIHA